MPGPILSAIPFRGLLVSMGLVLPGIVVFALVYKQFREKRHLGVLAVAAIALAQFGFQFGLVLAGGYRNNVELGMQFHRIAALFSAAEIAALPYFLSVSLDNVPRLIRFNATVARVGLVAVVGFALAAFIAPDTFVSVTNPESELVAVDIVDRGRGEAGVLYTVRNALLVLLTVYTAIIATIDLARSKSSGYAAPIAAGAIIAALFVLDDLFRLATGSYSGLLTNMSYSRFGFGLSIFVLFAMGGMTYRFVNDARRIRAARIQLVRNESAIERFAYTDALTALSNTARLVHDLAVLLNEIKGSDRTIALCIIDVERFRIINSLYGMRAGDQCIETIAGRLRENAVDEKKLYRITGNRFALLYVDIDPSHVDRHVVGILRALSAPMRIQEYAIHLSMRAGIALAPEHGNDTQQLIARCEAAVRVSESVMNPVVTYSEDLRLASDRYGEIVRALHRATDEDQFQMAYQPIVRADGSVATNEALLRWNHPQLGQVSPAEFIPIAEDVGLIIPITDLVSKKLLQGLIELRGAGIATSFNLNLSAKHLRQDDVCAELYEQLIKNDFSPSAIAMEVTESAVIGDLSNVAGSLRSISEMGFRIAIDDFGTGYSSFRYLQELPVQEIKIDREFLIDYPQDAKSRAMVNSIIELARSLDLVVVAEGVETATQLDTLAKEQCDLYQGWHFHKAMDITDLRDLLTLK